MLEEAEKRDHRKLGREMDLFHFEPEYAPGAVFWHDKGYKVYRKLIEYMRNRQEHNGYIEIATRGLWIAYCGKFPDTGTNTARITTPAKPKTKSSSALSR